MSSCDAHPVHKHQAGFRRLAIGGVMLAALAALGGCGDGGFRPMYASSVGGTRVDEKLAKVEIVHVGSKTGQRLRNELIFQTTGGGSPPSPQYRLQLTVTELLGATLVRTNGKSASSTYNLDVGFTLVDIQTKRVLLSGSSHAKAPFDRFLSIYSNVRAADDAANRSAKTVAEDLKSRLAAFLSSDRV